MLARRHQQLARGNLRPRKKVSAETHDLFQSINRSISLAICLLFLRQHIKIMNKACTYLPKEQHGEKDGEEGLHGLDGVREGNSDLAQAHVGEHIAHRVHQCQWQDLCILH